MEYEELLEQAYANVKANTSGNNGERFEIPKLNIQVVGNKTYISNVFQVCSHIRRTCEELCKFLSKELAAFCKIEGERLMLNRKLPEKQVQEKFKLYVEKFVLCKQCKKPDTEIIKQNNLTFMHCLACGAKNSLGKV